MGKLQNFAIEFEAQNGVCFAGQSVIGAVCVQLSDSTKLTGLRLKLNGRAKVHWTESSGSSKNRSTKTYRAEEIYIKEEVYLYGSSGGESSQLTAGTHRYPFTFSLPATLPSSFEGVHGSVRYTAEASMERPWKFDHTTRSAFTVISLVDLNLEPQQFKEPCELTSDKEVSCCCWKGGSVSAAVTLNKRCYVPGETIFFNARVNNSSTDDVTATRATLKQHTEFRARHLSWKSRWRSESLAKADGPPVIPRGTSTTWNNVAMFVPATVPSRLAGCGIINVNYVLELKLDAKCTKFLMPVEILIGTVPLRQTVYSLPAPQLNTVITSQPPSAPPCVTDQPPDHFDAPLPTYEECTMMGHVDIREDDDSEHIRGELSWCPRYPMYRQLSQPSHAPQQQVDVDVV